LLDSPGIVGEDYARTAKGVEFSMWKPLANGPVEFVTELTKSALVNAAYTCCLKIDPC
jgi:hypothetical protein